MHSFGRRETRQIAGRGPLAHGIFDRMTKSAFIAELADKNQRFYGTPDGEGVLRAFEQTFEHRWLYLFELVQNALDAGARSVALRTTEDNEALIFLHDGDCPLDERAVEALSKVFRSTKGATATGFMGVGFKSVFRRFREARVSGWGWTFRYEITQTVGERFGDVQPNLLGAVVPIWDDEITVPDAPFTTRFEMRRRDADSGTDLQADLARFLPDDDPALLPILAASGLKRLEADGRRWDLDIGRESDGTLEVAALSEDESRRWLLFSVDFDPSKEAIARFLERRRIQPSEADRKQVYAEADRPRRLLGVLPLDDIGTPVPPARGRIYATLPTEVTLPFGLHINADWLLNISRSGLWEIEDNPWQRGIVDCFADLLHVFLRWIARTLSDAATAKAAFKVLAPPSPGASSLEALLAEEHWLSRLRTRLEDAAVLPVWTEETDTLAFAKPGDVILPPPPLAKAFRKEPALQPALLLKGPVLIDEVLGPKARGLLRKTGLLAEMPPQALEQAWLDGVERWWTALPDEQEHRRTLLFVLWAAVAELTSEDPWRRVVLPCIRTANGRWLPVNKVVFFNESFPSEREPGGLQVRQFMQSAIPENRLPDGWIGALRNGKEREGWNGGPLSRALEWIEGSARRITLRELVKDALDDLASSPTPDWSILTPLGHWAKHRNQPALLTRVLAESRTGPRGVPIGKAVLADPYVEPSQGRRSWFPGQLALSATYLEQDPKNGGVHEWRMFFESAGLRGKLEVRTEDNRISRYQRERVAEFLGLPADIISDSNDGGYELQDFHIEPKLPGPDASEGLRKMLASWLEDGYRELEHKGRRKASYFYYSRHSRTGNTPSAWVSALTDLAWIPCEDGELRCPRDVLPNPDPGREGSPVANLSSELLRVLGQEGMKFGTAIPEATAIRKLSVTGSRLDAEELAQLLRECREQATTGEGRQHFAQVLQNLSVPSSDGGRVSLDRIVQRTGGRQRRGGLGGWLVPLDRIDKKLRVELEHADFPREFPSTTTGEQALAYVRDVWKRARSSSEGLANEVRDVLPTAYAYCLEDCADDPSLSDRWNAAIPEAAIFAEREWVFLEKTDDVYFDDLDDRRFFPEEMHLRVATSGHLGNSPSARLRTANALVLPLLSSSIEMEWYGEEVDVPVDDAWHRRFGLICELLRRVRGSEGVGVDRGEVDAGKGPRLKHVYDLSLHVSFRGEPAKPIPVNARLSGHVLAVAGRPVQFGADAAKELLRYFSFGQRANLAADLTGMLGAIDNRSDFLLAADKCKRSFAPDFELPEWFQRRLTFPKPADSEDEAAQFVKAEVDDEETAGTRAPESNLPTTNDESDSTSGSYTRDRALARPNALAKQLKSALKGELEPDDVDGEAGEATGPNGNSATDLGDEEYRTAVVQYEKEAGRKPELGEPHQTGWDVRSIDPQTEEIRLIEVKGKGCPWVGDEVVELSGAQVRKAFEVSANGTESWYLYVVEKTDGGYQVLPVENPVGGAAKWILRGESWRMVATVEAGREGHGSRDGDA